MSSFSLPATARARSDGFSCWRLSEGRVVTAAGPLRSVIKKATPPPARTPCRGSENALYAPGNWDCGLIPRRRVAIRLSLRPGRRMFWLAKVAPPKRSAYLQYRCHGAEPSPRFHAPGEIRAGFGGGAEGWEGEGGPCVRPSSGNRRKGKPSRYPGLRTRREPFLDIGGRPRSEKMRESAFYVSIWNLRLRQSPPVRYEP